MRALLSAGYPFAGRLAVLLARDWLAHFRRSDLGFSRGRAQFGTVRIRPRFCVIRYPIRKWTKCLGGAR